MKIMLDGTKYLEQSFLVLIQHQINNENCVGILKSFFLSKVKSVGINFELQDCEMMSNFELSRC